MLKEQKMTFLPVTKSASLIEASRLIKLLQSKEKYTEKQFEIIRQRFYRVLKLLYNTDMFTIVLKLEEDLIKFMENIQYKEQNELFKNTVQFKE